MSTSKRGHQRRPASLKADLFLLRPDGRENPADPGIPCAVLNISPAGAGIRSPKPVPQGTLIVVRLPQAKAADGATTPPKALFGVVRHCEFIGDRAHHLGVEFHGVPAQGPMARRVAAIAAR